MVMKINETQSDKIKKMVRKHCCNCIYGNCLLLDDGEDHKCVQLINSISICCNYFLKAVLPMNKELIAEIENCNGKKLCRNCGKSYYSKAKNSRYCGECAKRISLRKAADRVQKLRQKESNERT